jgi:hypothetical protein
MPPFQFFRDDLFREERRFARGFTLQILAPTPASSFRTRLPPDALCLLPLGIYRATNAPTIPQAWLLELPLNFGRDRVPTGL